MILAELNFAESVAIGFSNAAFTAVLVGVAAGLLIKRFEGRQADRRQQAENDAADRRQRAENDAAARRQQAEDDAAARREESQRLHEEGIQGVQLEFQTRAALRDSYTAILVAQRRSREASLRLAEAVGQDNRSKAENDAVRAHNEFIEHYHEVNIDASKEIWVAMRRMRSILDDMLKFARQGRLDDCKKLANLARHARQNLQIGFRRRLQHEPLQSVKKLGTPYDEII